MPKIEKNLPDNPISECPLCTSDDCVVVRGKKTLFIKKPDSVRCKTCKSEFQMDYFLQSVKFSQVASPYAFF